MPGDTQILTPSKAAPVEADPRPARPDATRDSALEPARDQSLDIAKGIGIFLVVVGHVFDGLLASNYFPPTLLWPTLVVLVIYLFHMPLFFVVSGHLASGRHRPALATIVKLLPTIVYPYFLWSIAEGLVMSYLSKYTTSHIPISLVYKILWIPIVPYWFLYALFFCHLGYLAVRKLPHWAQLTLAAIAFLAPQFFLPAFGSAHLNIIPETTRGFFYFILGVATVAEIQRFGRRTAIASTLLFAVLAFVYYVSRPVGAAAWPAAVPGCIAGIVATLAWSRVLAARGGAMVRTLAFWGRYSMSIYVLHIFVTAGMRIAFKRLAAHPTILATAIEIVVPTVLGIALPLAINRLVSRFDLDLWFGLQHMKPTRQPS